MGIRNLFTCILLVAVAAIWFPAQAQGASKDCVFYLNENIGSAKDRREAAASNARSRARGLPECKASRSGPTTGKSR